MASKIRYNIEGLTRLELALSKAKDIRARVGIVGEKGKRSKKKTFRRMIQGEGKSRGYERPEGDVTNAEVGFKQEFGYVVSDGAFEGAFVPARSFLRMPFRAHIEVLLKLVKPKVVPMLAAGNIGSFFGVLGIAGEKLVDQAFQTSGWGTWAPNAPTTVILKRSDKPLIDKGFLRRSIGSIVVKAK